MEYKFEDINIGDEVYFDSTNSQSNHDLYWKVLNKIENTKELIVGLDIMAWKDERWTIKIRDVRLHTPIPKK